MSRIGHHRPILAATAAATVAASLLVAPTAAGAAELRITAPGSGIQSGLIDLAADAPDGTTALRWSIDGTRIAELTDSYATQVGVEPSWRTVTDASWLTPGQHVLTAEADTPSGTRTATLTLQTQRTTPTPGVVPLTGAWSFQPADALPDGALAGDTPPAVTAGTDGWPSVIVPSSIGALDDDWNSQDGLRGIFRRSLRLPEATDGQRTYLTLESCYFSCDVFVNGQPVGTTEGGYTRNRFDITRQVVEGDNQLAVIVDNRLTAMGPLRRSHNFYWNWGGLLQEVSLERTPAVSLIELRAEGTADGRLTLRPEGVNGTGIPQQVTALLQVDGPDGRMAIKPTQVTTTVPAAGGATTPITVTVPDARLWDLDHPRLYTVRLQPLDDAAHRTLTERTGFRTIGVQGADLTLNGDVVGDLPGFNRHADYPGLGRTQPGELAHRELKKLHDKGFRIFRPAHYPTTSAELDAADELGMLVIEEVNVTGLTGAELASQRIRDFGRQQLTRMIRRDRSHPSVFAWSVGNENLTEQAGATTYVGETIAAGRHLDPNRLYTQVTHRGTNDKTLGYQDFVAVNYYAGWYTGNTTDVVGRLDSLQKFSGDKPILLSEYGAEGVRGRGGFGKGGEWYQALVVDDHNRLLSGRDHLIGKLYWTSTEFWCRPDWAGGNPDPVPPFHTKALIGLDRVEKLAWRVMFSPVRIEAPAPVAAEPAHRTTVEALIRLTDVRHRGANGVLHTQAPEGFTADPAQVPFTVDPDGSTEVTVRLTGTLPATVDQLSGMVRAVIDDDTEALPRPLLIRRADTVTHPASDTFDSPTLGDGWSIVREQPDGWSLSDRPGSLRLSTLPGGETQNSNDGPNLFVRDTTPTGDFTAVASVDVPAADTDYQQVALFAYAGDDDYLRVSLGHIDGRRAVEAFAERGGDVTLRASVPVDAQPLKLRLVRRATTVAAEFSVDGGDTWRQVGSASVPQRVKVGLQAVGGRAAPPVVDTYVDDLTVLVSGAISVSPAPHNGLLLGGTTNTVPLVVDNQSATTATADVTLTAPDGWTVVTRQVTLPPFTAQTVQVPVTPPVTPTQTTLRAAVTSADHLVVGATQLPVLTTTAADHAALALDAGSATSPLLDGYQRLAPTDAYDPAKGYGWIGEQPGHRDRGHGDPLRRDFALATTPRTLRLQVPPGRHDVYVLRGDTDYSSGGTAITEDNTVLVPAGGTLARNTFEWLHFTLDGGTAGRTADLTISGIDNNYWRLNALVLLP